VTRLALRIWQNSLVDNVNNTVRALDIGRDNRSVVDLHTVVILLDPHIGKGLERHVAQERTPYCNQVVTVLLDLSERQPKNKPLFMEIIVGFK